MEHPGRMRPHRDSHRSDVSTNTFQFMTYEERRKLPPAPGTIRLLSSSEQYPRLIARFWNIDMSLTEWITEFRTIQTQYEEQSISSVLYPPNYMNTLQTIFMTNQRHRFLVRKVYQRWSRRVWMKRTQCNVSLIEMTPIPEKDVLYLTDTKHHQIFRFHRADLFKNFLTNIGSCDEMLPSPRHPTNPWTNEPLTLQQTLYVGSQMISYYASKGTCPPMIFTAYHRSNYSISQFRYKHASLLAQHAIATYFMEITLDNQECILETIVQLLLGAGCLHAYSSIRRWLQGTYTPLHKEWLSFVCDYTMYMNLHVQVRPHWYNRTYILLDVRRLYERSYSFRTVVRQRGSSAIQAPVQAPVQASAFEPSFVVQFYNPNQLLGLMLSSELEGTMADLLLEAQRLLDEQEPSVD